MGADRGAALSLDVFEAAGSGEGIWEDNFAEPGRDERSRAAAAREAPAQEESEGPAAGVVRDAEETDSLRRAAVSKQPGDLQSGRGAVGEEGEEDEEKDEEGEEDEEAGGVPISTRGGRVAGDRDTSSWSDKHFLEL